MKTCWVGNDIVDLTDVDGQLETYGGRFVSRVCTGDEMGFVDSAQNPEEIFWQIWTAKETAFKIYQRLNPGESFKPKYFEVNLLTCLVTHSGCKIEVKWDKTCDYVFCAGHLEKDSVPKKIFSSISALNQIEQNSSIHLTESEQKSAQTPESCAVRILAKTLLSQTLNLDWADTEIIRRPIPHDWAPPEIRYKGRLLDRANLSLTHHGRFFACTISFS